MTSINNIKFSNGLEIPALGLGTYKVSNNKISIVWYHNLLIIFCPILGRKRKCLNRSNKGSN